MCYLRDGPIRTLTDVRNTKAEAVGAAQRVLLLQVVKTRFALITVDPHHVHLRSNRRSQGYWSPQTAGHIRAYLAGAGAARVAVGASCQVALTGSAGGKIPEPECTAVTALTREAVLTLALTRGHTWTHGLPPSEPLQGSTARRPVKHQDRLEELTWFCVVSAAER